jgi:hypothetical protein
VASDANISPEMCITFWPPSSTTLYVDAGVAFLARSSNPVMGLPRNISQFLMFLPLKSGFWENAASERKNSEITIRVFFMIVGFGYFEQKKTAL